MTPSLYLGSLESDESTFRLGQRARDDLFRVLYSFNLCAHPRSAGPGVAFSLNDFGLALMRPDPDAAIEKCG